jgi:hypothetical protein
VSLAVYRSAAIDQAIASSRLSGLELSLVARKVYAAWVADHCSTDEAVTLLIQHYREHPVAQSDGQAQPNKLALTDRRQLKEAEADIATLRMADLLLLLATLGDSQEDELMFPSVTEQPERRGYDARQIHRLEELDPPPRRPEGYVED